MLTFRFISALPSLGRRLLPRRKAYDWSTWLDGRWHVLKRGEHYRKASAFRDAAKEHAAERGLSVVVLTRRNGKELSVRALPRVA
jgi:hypothetical protein